MRFLLSLLAAIFLAVPAAADEPGWSADAAFAAMLGARQRTDGQTVGLGPAIRVLAPTGGGFHVGAAYEHLFFLGGDAVESSAHLDEATFIVEISGRPSVESRVGVDLGLGVGFYGGHTEQVGTSCIACGADLTGLSTLAAVRAFAAGTLDPRVGIFAAARFAYASPLGNGGSGTHTFAEPELSLQLEVGFLVTL